LQALESVHQGIDMKRLRRAETVMMDDRVGQIRAGRCDFELAIEVRY